VKRYNVHFQGDKDEDLPDSNRCSCMPHLPKYIWSDGTCSFGEEEDTGMESGYASTVPLCHRGEFRRVMNAVNSDVKVMSQTNPAISDIDLDALDIPFIEYVDYRLAATGPTRDFVLAQGFNHSGSKAADVSALSILHDICSFGSAEEAFCGSLSRISCGAGGLSQRIADDLYSRDNVELRLETAVTDISSTSTGVDIRLQNGTSIKCHYVVVAVPLNVLKDIVFTPALRTDLCDAGDINVGRCHKYWTKLSQSIDSLKFDQTISWSESESAVVESYLRPCGNDECTRETVCAAFSLKDYHADVGSLESDICSLYGLESVSRTDATAKADGFVIHHFLAHDWCKDIYSKGTWLAIKAGKARAFSNIMSKVSAPLVNPTAAAAVSYNNVVLAGGDVSLHWHGWVEGAIESGLSAATTVLLSCIAQATAAQSDGWVK
jgi:hypothetical protein